MSILFFLALLCMVAFGHPNQERNTFYVPGDYETIQEAIDAANEWDTIVVRAGTYPENVVITDSTSDRISLISEDGPAQTIIDGGKNGCVLSVVNNHGLLLSGFTIRNGLASEDQFGYYSGGGLYAWQSTLAVKNCLIKDNEAESRGGGMYVENSTPLIAGNVLSGNSAFGSNGFGGGINIEDCPEAVLHNNILDSNESTFRGGGIFFSTGVGVFTSNTIVRNTAGTEGGGICNGPGMITVSNTIIWENSAPADPEIYDAGNLIITYCAVKDGWPGAGNIADYPNFVDPDGGDFHLVRFSPCRNKGANAAPGLADTDFEGDLRIVDGRVDIGADEFDGHLYLVGDIVPGDPIEIKVVGEPGMRASLLMSAIFLDPPLETYFGNLYLQPPFLVEAFIGEIKPIGVIVLNVTVPASWSAGERYYLQALVGDWYETGMELTNPVKLIVE